MINYSPPPLDIINVKPNKVDKFINKKINDVIINDLDLHKYIPHSILIKLQKIYIEDFEIFNLLIFNIIIFTYAYGMFILGTYIQYYINIVIDHIFLYILKNLFVFLLILLIHIILVIIISAIYPNLKPYLKNLYVDMNIYQNDAIPREKIFIIANLMLYAYYTDYYRIDTLLNLMEDGEDYIMFNNKWNKVIIKAGKVEKIIN